VDLMPVNGVPVEPVMSILRRFLILPANRRGRPWFRDGDQIGKLAGFVDALSPYPMMVMS
jgi:hypothetical protein